MRAKPEAEMRPQTGEKSLLLTPHRTHLPVQTRRPLRSMRAPETQGRTAPAACQQATVRTAEPAPHQPPTLQT